MTKELEIEFKNMLTESEYSQLLAFFGKSRSDAVLQANHYFDTPDGQLKAQKCALRIRQKSDLFECTLKIPAPEGNYEITDKLSQEQAYDMLNGEAFYGDEVKEALKELDVTAEALQPFGTLTTNRVEFPFENGLLVLDHSEFGNFEDYEVEYEVSEPAKGKAIFLQLLQEHHIPLRPAEKKIVRFVNSLKKGE